MSSERQENKSNPWWGEHVHRYELAVKYFKAPAKLLDIACGSGFGSHLLAKNGFEVTGGDISEEAIEICRANFSNPGLEFKVINATRIPYPDKYFDGVVSFETIEHTTEYIAVLKEYKRVTKTGGIVLISTPNILINSPGGKIINPYHTQEWNYEQLHDIFSNIFSSVQIFGQEYTRYKDKKNIWMIIGQVIENFFYLRGIRKTPIQIQDKVVKLLTGKPMYPLASDYSLVSDPKEIKKCKTFFAVCKP